MNLPPDLLAAVSAPGGGKITLVVGAGCSFEAPTSIPLAGRCSQECHDRLVADNVLAAGDCPTPSNLSCLADTVFSKTGRQLPLVEQLSQHYSFKAATPNEGHLLAAALLREGAIGSVVTLNFDLALSTAIGCLGVGDIVGIIDGPDDLPNQKAINLYYLHRNVTAADPETWILRTEGLKTEWKGRWQSVVAAKVLSTPVVVFAGLGSPADVLIESTKLIQNAIPNGNKTYQVDTVDYNSSEFFKALALDPSAFIRATWCEFMAALSQRLVVDHTNKLRATAVTMVERDQLTPEDITALLNRVEDIGLLHLGHLRASWLLHEKPYYPDDPLARELIADLLLAAAMVARVAGATAILFEDGIVEFRRGDRTVATHVFVSGRGSRSRVAIESELSARQRRFRGRAIPPTGAIIAGTRDSGTTPVTIPPDVLLGDTSKSILFGQSAIPIFHVEALREDPTQSMSVVP
jgi:hypothetical protein